jgi:hypothetical protein
MTRGGGCGGVTSVDLQGFICEDLFGLRTVSANAEGREMDCEQLRGLGCSISIQN